METNNIFIISGPAGSGKDTIIAQLEVLLPLERIITTTSRAPRPGEQNGVSYYFISREEFERRIHEGSFLEYSINENDAYYGVTREEIDRVSRSGKIGIWKMDWKGVLKAKELFPSMPALFISAPLPILENRLRNRDVSIQDPAYFHDRMEYTREWLKHTDIYDYSIENEEGKLDQTVKKVADLIKQHRS